MKYFSMNLNWSFHLVEQLLLMPTYLPLYSVDTPVYHHEKSQLEHTPTSLFQQATIDDDATFKIGIRLYSLVIAVALAYRSWVLLYHDINIT